MKSKVLAYTAWFFAAFGILGFQRFYLQKHGTAFLWMFTGGLVGAGALWDLFTLAPQVDRYNDDIASTAHSS